MHFTRLVACFCTGGPPAPISFVLHDAFQLQREVQIPKIIAAAVVATCCFATPLYPTCAADVVNNELSVGTVLHQDISPRVQFLRTIEREFTTYPSLIDNRNYESIRRSLRHEPTVELRRISKQIMKYLPADQYSVYGKAYDAMITAVDKLDRVALDRTRGVGLPAGQANDIDMHNQVEDVISKLNIMLNIVHPTVSD